MARAKQKRRFRLMKGTHYERQGTARIRGRNKGKVGVRFTAGVKGRDIVETDGVDLCKKFVNKFVEITNRPDDDKAAARSVDDMNPAPKDPPADGSGSGEGGDDVGLTMEHRGGGKFNVVNADGEAINDVLLTKEEAESLIANPDAGNDEE